MDYHSLLRSGPLQNEDGVLTPRRRLLIPIKHKSKPQLKKELIVNHKELVSQMRNMHNEQMAQLKILTEAVLKLAESGVAIHQGTAIINEPRRGDLSLQTEGSLGIEMDESVFVTQVDTSTIEKGYENIAETKVEKDKNLKSNLSKLRSLKKGD